jgi:hypothetical protein
MSIADFNGSVGLNTAIVLSLEESVIQSLLAILGAFRLLSWVGGERGREKIEKGEDLGRRV